MMSLQKPLVSVIIATFNSANYLEIAINSALKQTYPNKEVIIVDDGSTDDTDLILKKYRSYNNVKIIKQDNKGVAAARNKGIFNARGEYVAILDADDYWYCNRLEVMIEYMLKYKIDLAISNYFLVNEKREKLRDIPAYDKSFNPPQFDKQYKSLLLKSVSFSMMICKTDILKAHGGYDESLKGDAEDYDLWLRLLKDGVRWGYVSEPLAEYMIRTNGVSKKYSKNRRTALKKIFFKHRSNLGFFRAFFYYRYHLGGYRLDMFLISVKSKNIKNIIVSILRMLRSPLIIPIFASAVIMRKFKKYKGGYHG